MSTQACVVTLEPVPAHMEARFVRECTSRDRPGARSPKTRSVADLVLDAAEEEEPEEIESLHYDLAGPALEEYVWACRTYPRAPGVAFQPLEVAWKPPKAPFAVLKGLENPAFNPLIPARHGKETGPAFLLPTPPVCGPPNGSDP